MHDAEVQNKNQYRSGKETVLTDAQSHVVLSSFAPPCHIEDHHGEDRYWITDHDVQCVSVCAPDGRELRRTGPDALAAKYPDLNKYHPTNSAVMPDGDFFISDGYGSSFVHHMDPEGHYISSFGGTGDAPSNLNTPHAVWIDTRSGKPSLLVCDRGNEMLKWFSLSGELQQIVPVPGAQPSNVALSMEPTTLDSKSTSPSPA
jgi:peptidylamidoglycolate lyase